MLTMFGWLRIHRLGRHLIRVIGPNSEGKGGNDLDPRDAMPEHPESLRELPVTETLTSGSLSDSEDRYAAADSSPVSPKTQDLEDPCAAADPVVR